jgi:hypothetical protein
MKRDGHHPIGAVKRLLDAISVVNVDVNVEHTLVPPAYTNSMAVVSGGTTTSSKRQQHVQQQHIAAAVQAAGAGAGRQAEVVEFGGGP